MDTPLKQRLIGAIVLVALAVIFLPMLVKGPAPDSGVANVPISAPAAPSDGQFETRELPLVAPTGGATGLQSGASTTQPLADSAAVAADPAPADTSPAVAAGNYAVSFGAYASEADADRVIASLKSAQLAGFREPATINGRQAWRVRVGPYADRALAEAGRLQAVKVRNDVKAEVITLDARADTAVAATPAATAPSPSAAPAASSAAAAPSGNTVKTESLPAEPVAAAKPEPKPAAPKPEPKPAPAPKPDTAAAAPVAAPAAPAASSVGFAVQLGAFGQAAEANALRDKVRAAGFSAFVEQVRTDKGTLNRVRVGPVANRADAENLKAQVAAKVGVAGMVRPHP
ncbi:sporulation protein [Stenotrophomonas maltophilia]|uniref:Sporulation protein n=1 Tax=Stenotrophomonas maltophilia TaxID=40324 RepID=A0A246HHN4_STEMA|nr:SPOR domain-containing protein [Stenotrophomonas maltophilia]OWQ49789.1 sporulation protein [Stenotrophomonas maltophilia]